MIRFHVAICCLTLAFGGFQQLSGQDSTTKKSKELEWIKFEEQKFDRERFGRPIIIAFMRDLCPGCKAKRDALWTDAKVTKTVADRNFFLFNGNAQVDKEEAKIVKKNFKVDSYPVVIMIGKGMSDKPILLKGIPEPDQVVKAIEKHFPMADKKPVGNEKSMGDK